MTGARLVGQNGNVGTRPGTASYRRRTASAASAHHDIQNIWQKYALNENSGKSATAAASPAASGSTSCIGMSAAASAARATA
jgi:hypothetical protein